MEGVIRKISLTAGEREDNNPDLENSGTDVIVEFENGDEYVATFFSLQNMASVLTDYKQSDDHYRIIDAVLVNDYNYGRIKSVIEEMMDEGDFQVVFRKL